MWWCFLCFFFVFSLVFQFYVLEYGIHFCRRDFWIVLFVPFHIFILYACVSHISTCDSATVVTLVRAICICFYDLLCGYSLCIWTVPSSIPRQLTPFRIPFGTLILIRHSVDVCAKNLTQIWRIDSPWLTLRLWAQPVSHLMLETFRRRPCQAIRGMTCKRHFSCGYFTEQQTFLKVQVYIYSASLLVFQIEPHFVLQNEPPTYDMHHLHPIFFRCK